MIRLWLLGFFIYPIISEESVMSQVEGKLASLVSQALKELYSLEDFKVNIEIPKNNQYGDYATTAAMQLAGKLHRNPREIAEEIKGKLEEDHDFIDTVEIAGPGFINFRVKKTSLAQVINRILEEGADYGHNEAGKGTHILVEYVSANPTGDLHLGHARGAVWGDCLCRLLKASGFDCLPEYYINDAGNQMINLGKSVYARYAEYFGEKVEIPEDGYMGEDVKNIGYELAEELGDEWLHKEEGRIDFFREQGRKRELDKIEKDLKDFRVHMESWISEKKLYESGRVDECVKEMTESGLTYEKDGALWFSSTKWGDDKDRVLVKADGALTYLTPDIANHIYKFERGYNKLVNLWGADHHGYIARMKAAMQAFGHEKDDLEIDIIQMVHLVEDGKEVKMSKRSGNAITIRELIEDIGVDAARYFFVSRAVESQLDFDLTLARKQTTENPVYYVQYAHSRACGVLRNAEGYEKKESYDLLTDEKEIDLLKMMNEFPDVVADAAITRSPNRICNYLQKFASLFHSYYGSCKMNDPEHKELSNERLAFVDAVRTVIANALELIGVSAPEKM